MYDSYNDMVLFEAYKIDEKIIEDTFMKRPNIGNMINQDVYLEN